MAGKPIINDVEKTKLIVEEFKKDLEPTKAGLMRLLGIHSENTLYRALDKEDEISEILFEAWLYIVEMHERGLFSRTPVGHIYFLKTLRKYLSYKEYDAGEYKNNSINFKYEIVKREDKPTTGAVPTSTDEI